MTLMGVMITLSCVSEERANKGLGLYVRTHSDEHLHSVWTDPDFDPHQPAFYYVRVIAIPTPRWNTYDSSFYGQQVADISENPWNGTMETVALTIQERLMSRRNFLSMYAKFLIAQCKLTELWPAVYER